MDNGNDMRLLSFGMEVLKHGPPYFHSELLFRIRTNKDVYGYRVALSELPDNKSVVSYVFEKAKEELLKAIAEDKNV